MRWLVILLLLLAGTASAEISTTGTIGGNTASTTNGIGIIGGGKAPISTPSTGGGGFTPTAHRWVWNTHGVILWNTNGQVLCNSC